MGATPGASAVGATPGALAARPDRTASLVRAVLIALGLIAVVGARWAATVAEAPPLVVGALFGGALIGIAWAGGFRPAAIRPGAVLLGLAGAVVLVGLAVGATRLAGFPLRVVPQTDFGWWALITIVVATAEELILRGVLFDAIYSAAGGEGVPMAESRVEAGGRDLDGRDLDGRDLDGRALDGRALDERDLAGVEGRGGRALAGVDGPAVAAAVLATSLLFALIHVPLYGWHVVPLDFGVGVFLAGLRLASGSVTAPVIAHVVADLATWWV
jgi:membrane protease YdiL (CAAX protease family)